jgi:Soluble lytic murein transglycosylase and related regulatory proteins (some contain LysM/invasin domains)
MLRRSTSLLLALALASLACSAVASAAASPGAKVRAEFEAAWQRVQHGQPDQTDPPELRRYLIYPYLQAARIQRDLGGDAADAADADAAAFLKQHHGDPVTHDLRIAWLRSLARRKQWQRFAAHAKPLPKARDLQCDDFQARIALQQTDGLADQVRGVWLSGHSQPDGCDPAFDWLRQQGVLDDALTAKRARLALEAGNAGLARVLLKTLPDGSEAGLRQWAKLLLAPQKELQSLVDHPKQKVDNDALQAAFYLLARRHPGQAETLLPGLLTRVSDVPQRNALTRSLALGMVWDRRPQALTYFRRVDLKPADQVALAWRIRAALWAGDWRQAAAWLAELPPAMRDQPGWTYWRGRAAAELGNPGLADRFYRRLADSDGYYALLAATRRGVGVVPHPAALANNPKERAKLARLPGMRRAHALFEVHLEHQAVREWWHALHGASPDARLQAIRLAHHWGWYREAVAMASSQGVYDAYRLLYPRPYPQAVKAAAAAADLPRDWIYGVMRQESLFDAHAQSSAGARGLLQMMPATAQAEARRLDVKLTGDDPLFDPMVNLHLGAMHLRSLLDRFDGHLPVALAAYNAGRHAAQRWLPDHPMAVDVWIENIPYNETRGYVRRILWHIAVFGWRASGKPQHLAPLLTPVGEPAPTREAAS